jgi:formyltetrahydrofolate-dependent phosphoribosylglycinamide formyltransferase
VTTRLAILASGGGSNMEAIADYLDRLSAPTDGRGTPSAPAPPTIVLVASDRPDAGVLQRARRRGIDACALADHADAAELSRLLTTHRIDLIALAGYLRHVPDSVTRAFRGRIVNIHPSLLPAFGGPGMYGRRVHAAVVAAGVRVSGATVHFVDEAYDRGPIIAQWPVPVSPDDTPDAVAARVLVAEHQLYPRTIAAVAAGRITLGEDGRVRGRPNPGPEIDRFGFP